MPVAPARILVIGSPRAGKSTLARALAARTGLPLIHLDQEYWLPGWVEPEKAAWRATVGSLVARPQWIIDGNYSGTLPLRLAAADTVVVLDVPAWRCVWRVVRRVAGLRGRVRPDMPPGCPERFNLEFLGYVACFPWARLPRVRAALAGFDGRCEWLRTAADAAALLDRFDRDRVAQP